MKQILRKPSLWFRFKFAIYRYLVKNLKIDLINIGGVNTKNLHVIQWTCPEVISDELMSNLVSEVYMGAPLMVLKPNDPETFDPHNIDVADVDWSQTKTSAQLIDELYDDVVKKLISDPKILRNMIEYTVHKDFAGHPTHIIFKLIAAKTNKP